MNHYAQRLTHVARAFGCPVHEERLWCPTCEPLDPMPEPLTTAAGDFIKSILVRVGQQRMQELSLRVGMPPNHGPCARCGTRRHCWSCKERHTKTLLRTMALTAEEQHTLETILATCRRLEREGRAHDEL